MKKLEYHDFWQIFMDEYLPEKITNEWLLHNEAFVEEIMNSTYRNYELSNSSCSNDDKVIMRILSEVFLNAYTYFGMYNLL